MKEAAKTRANGLIQAVLTAIFLAPIGMGIYLVAGNASRGMHADEISRDLASMYSQGVDFSQPANRSIAMRLLGTDADHSLVILTRMRAVSEPDCTPSGASDCVNNGYPVVVQRIVIGDATLRESTLGAPRSIDPSTGTVLNWAHDASARVPDAGITLKPGESAYAAEAYLSAPGGRQGVFARSVF